MGMAASQARFLGLTARKTNVEYEEVLRQEKQTLNMKDNKLTNKELLYPMKVRAYLTKC